jgi:hypothetical protein
MTRDDPAAFAPPPAFGPFRVLHQIGIGALGPVYRTYEPTRDRLVAVKVFRLDITPEQAQVLADELSKAAEASLFHPSIVEPIAAGVEGTVAYRAEEYVAAESLDVAIRHYAPAALDKALPFLTQLAGAIDFARTAGVGHGALHLRDVFVTPDDARASGFGIVEALERVGLRAPVRRPYSAPERIAGEAWSTPADVFSLGAIAYELLTGRRPSGTGDQIGALTGGDAGAYAAPIRAVLARAMDDEPDARYPTALAFASALEAAGRGAQRTSAVAGAGAISAAAPVAAIPAPVDAPAPIAASIEPASFEPPPTEPALIEHASTDEEAEPEDVYAEREDDVAHHALLLAEAEEDTDLPVYDDEGAADLMLDAPDTSRQFNLAELDRAALAAGSPASWQGDDEAGPGDAESGEAASYRRSGRARDSASMNDEAHGGMTLERPRPAMLPMAMMLILGLMLGFAAGYVVAERGPATEGQAAATPASPSPAPPGSAQLPQPGQTQPQRSGRAYSEQIVRPPSATPPPVPADAPRGDSARSAPSRGAVPGTGQVVVQSNPARAGVTVNGDWRGRTPLTISGLKFGSYTVRIVQPGFVTAREEVTLSAAQPSRSVSARLQRAVGSAPSARGAAPAARVGSIYVDSRPRGARVVLDGRLVGTTPARIPDVPIGTHVVRLELPDHRIWSTSTNVAPGREASVTGSLERIQ